MCGKLVVMQMQAACLVEVHRRCGPVQCVHAVLGALHGAVVGGVGSPTDPSVW